MITREQAEQAFREYSAYLAPTYEIDNPVFEQITLSDFDWTRLVYADWGCAEFEEEAWVCTFEKRCVNSTDGGWYPWYTTKRYIVAAKPGPYVIE